MIKVKTSKESRVCQGDIIQDVEHLEYAFEQNGIIEVSKCIFPLIIVLTQDCDLAQDYKFRWSRYNANTDDKKLLSILVAPLYNAEHFFEGKHLSDLGLTMLKIPQNKTNGKNILNNETPRYHYLEFPSNIPIVPSVIDFKHYFSVNVEYIKKVKKERFVCKISEIYREDISLRFANYLGRIGLP